MDKVIAVTGLHRGDNPQPGAAVIRSLRRMYPDVRIVGLSYDPLESGLFSHGLDRVDAAYSVAFPGHGPEALKERLADILATEKIDAIIPCLDSEIENFITLAGFFAERGIKTLLPPRGAIKKRDKAQLAEFCVQNHIHCPKTVSAYDATTLVSAVGGLGGYPVFIKGPLYEGRLINNAADLAHYANQLLQKWGGPVLAQQALVGEEYCVTGVADENSNLLAHCAIRKLLVTSAGKGFAGIVITDPDLNRIAERIIRQLEWTGPFELEFVKPIKGPHMLIEINPRFPAWIDFPSQIGCNLPGMLLDRLFEVKGNEPKACPAGRMFIRHSIDLVGDISDIARLVTTGTMHYFQASLAEAEIAE